MADPDQRAQTVADLAHHLSVDADRCHPHPLNHQSHRLSVFTHRLPSVTLSLSGFQSRDRPTR